MLSLHTVFIVPDNNLLLGTRQGHLLMYSLTSGNGNNQKYEVQILHYCKTISKKPIQQIEVIPGQQTIYGFKKIVRMLQKITI